MAKTLGMPNSGRGNWITHRWLEGMKNGTATLENNLTVSYKTNHVITVQARSCTLGHLLREMKLMFTQKPVRECISPRLGDNLASSSVSEWNKQTGAHP